MKKTLLFQKLLVIFVIFFYTQTSYSQTTYTVTSTSNTGPGSFTEAVTKANANPGTDIIEFTPGLQVDANVPNVGPSNDIMAKITESVIIDGKGGALNGKQFWINSSGIVNSLSFCPGDVPTTLQTAYMPGFIEVGTFDQDNSGIDVIIRNLNISQFNQVAKINKNASLVLENFKATDTWATYLCSGNEMIEAYEGVDLTIKDSEFNEAINWAIPGIAASIEGVSNAGNLKIERTVFKGLYNSEQPAVLWIGKTGSVVNIVSSRFQYSGGISIYGHSESNIVNSIWTTYYFETPNRGDIIVNSSSGDMNIIASSFVWNTNQCNLLCQGDGLNNLFEIVSSGNINFMQSAVGFNFNAVPGEAELNTLGIFGSATGVFTADEYTWMQPTTQQNAAQLKTITNQPALLTDSFGFNGSVVGLTEDYDVEMATPAFPGELIDVIPLSSTLTNPIDGLPITLDVVGNPRLDANNKRDIGALQLGLTPFLAVNSNGDAFVELSWNEPLHHNGLAIIKYEILYSESGGSGTTITIDPPALTKTISGLTNGTDYDFQVRAIYTGPENGPYSNIVTARPIGSLGDFTLTAVPGNTEVSLSWTQPDLGGRDFEAYTILWRVQGATDYIGALATYSPSETNITVTGLTNGNTYEFVVTVNASGDINQAFAIATPNTGLGIDDLDLINGKFSYYPNPVHDYLHIDLDEEFQAKLFSINGALLMEIKNKKNIDVSKFNTGIYILQIQVNDKLYSGKILKK
ncbi:fibronectin type III domain-containing protein [Pseudotamlana carrageenivorans]|uniref:Fibronectin type-III domain-containing protein n=1 Tax=Pseudotamlana carrageenivorans TaxID=2069432 RepID=A0A2I7SKR2_9FLAO|nr:fibronectin type III domain-containing protein [Tamlana carrageenivorans]AUS06505.1 hypothetical protein C1A40_14115 [Tamlana carrageenivorans]